MLLTDLLRQYRCENDIADSTAEQYGFAVGSLGRFLLRPAVVDDLTDDALNRWLEWMQGRACARSTIRGQRGALLTLWNAAYVMRLLESRPGRVKRLRSVLPTIEAYTLAEMARLLAATASLSGIMPCGASRSTFFRALLLVAWYSGLRPIDVRQLRWRDIDGSGVMLVRQSKTGEFVMKRLPADARKALAAITGKREWVFPISRKMLRYWFRKLIALAGVRGTPKWIRRASATAVENERPGSAMSHLGHKTPGLAWRHYIDRRQIRANTPLPPAIG